MIWLIGNKNPHPLLMGSILLLVMFLVGCASDDSNSSPNLALVDPSRGDINMSGSVEIDGSSTVYPVSEAVAEEFNKLYPDVRVNVGVSGTGGGFKRLTAGETDISDASRPIKNPKETSAAEANGI